MDDTSSAFLSLVDEHVSHNPLKSTALTPNALRYIAAKLMLRHLGRAQPATELLKMASILFVLIMEECVHLKNEIVLGFKAEVLYEALREYASSIEATSLAKAVAKVDLVGRASIAAEEPDCIKFLMDPQASEIGSFTDMGEDEDVLDDIILQQLKRAREDGGGLIAALPTCVPEMAGLHIKRTATAEGICIEGSPPAAVAPSIEHRLAAKLSLRSLFMFGALFATLTLYTLSWKAFLPALQGRAVGMVDLSAWWSLAASLLWPHLKEQTFTVVMLCLLLLATAFFAMMFPRDLTTPSARRLINAMMVLSVFGELQAVAEHHALYTETRGGLASLLSSSLASNRGGGGMDAPTSCLLVHYLVLAWVVLFSNCYAVAAHCLYDASWRRFRVCFFLDGAFWLACILALWALGEENFPPGDVPIHAAFGRPLAPLLVAALFGEATRRRLAAWADARGLNHVTFGLQELHGHELQQLASVWVPGRRSDTGGGGRGGAGISPLKVSYSRKSRSVTYSE